jgi:hypothetical protein
MVAMPGRQFDVKGTVAAGALANGSHRFWLPRFTANHLNGINSLEEFDSALRSCTLVAIDPAPRPDRCEEHCSI